MYIQINNKSDKYTCNASNADKDNNEDCFVH